MVCLTLLAGAFPEVRPGQRDDFGRSALASPGNPALAITIDMLRRHPDLARWVLHPDGDTAHEVVVAQWRRHPAVAALLKPWKDEERLLDEAVMFLGTEDGQLRLAWELAVSGQAWAELPESARCLYQALHAKAAEAGRRGGPRVMMSNRVALAVMTQVTGRVYGSIATVTKARAALVAAGFITVEAGESWAAGKGTKATICDLLPEVVMIEVNKALSPERGQFTSAARPVLDAVGRKELEEVISGRRAEKAMAVALWRNGDGDGARRLLQEKEALRRTNHRQAGELAKLRPVALTAQTAIEELAAAREEILRLQAFIAGVPLSPDGRFAHGGGIEVIEAIESAGSLKGAIAVLAAEVMSMSPSAVSMERKGVEHGQEVAQDGAAAGSGAGAAP